MIYEFQSFQAARLAAQVQAFLKNEDQAISRGGDDEAAWIWVMETDIDPLIAMFILEVYAVPPQSGRPYWWRSAAQDLTFRTKGLLNTADPNGADLRLLEQLEKQAEEVPYGLDENGSPRRLEMTRAERRRLLDIQAEDAHQRMLDDPVYQEDKRNHDIHEGMYGDSFDTKQYWSGGWSNTTRPDDED